MKEELLDLIKKAMLSKNAVELRTLRLIKTDFGEHEKAKDAKELTPEVEVTILNKMVKERNDSIEKYTEAGRLDLVKQEQEEKDFLMTFLPKQLDVFDIRIILCDCQFQSIGECMKYFKENYAGRYDGKLVSKTFNEIV
jgi:uncharacterized protein YqeY